MTRKVTLLGIVPVLALSLSACGSSNGDPGTSSSPMSSMDMSSSSSSSAAPSSSSSEQVPASVAPGTTITIKNEDSQAHTVTSKDGGFDVKIDPKATATMKAPDKAGSYPFVCTFHANMSSTLVVK